MAVRVTIDVGHQITSHELAEGARWASGEHGSLDVIDASGNVVASFSRWIAVTKKNRIDL